MQINCVASYCACSQSFNRLAHSQSSNVTRRMAGASLYLSIFSFASKPALHYGEVKDEEGKRIVYNITDEHLCPFTVLYDLLSQCSSGRERIGWLLLKFKVNMKQVFFLFAWYNLDSELIRRAKKTKTNSIAIFLFRVWATENVKFHFRGTTKPRKWKQETGNDCNVISGHSFSRQAYLLVISPCNNCYYAKK